MRGRTADIGALVNAGAGSAGSSLFTVADMRKIRVYVRVAQIPAPDHGVEHSRQVVDPFVHATAKLPVANFLSYRFCRHVADAGTEVDEVLAPAILRPSSLKV